MQRPATSLLETIIRQEIVSLREQFNKTPKATAGDIQRFLGVSVDGDFGDDSAKAAANFIYGKNTSHGIQTVSDLYDRMQSDGWAVGAKTGTIFGPQMAKSIVQLISLRQGPSGWEKKEKAYSGYPTLNKWKFGLDYGGRDKYSTTQVTDFNTSFKSGQKNPNIPSEVNIDMTREEAGEIFRKFIKRAYAGVKTPRKLSVPGVIDSNCDGLKKLIKSLQILTVNELLALYKVNKSLGTNNIFNWIIDYGLKYYPSVKGKEKIRTASCNMYPKQLYTIQGDFAKGEQHVEGLIDLTTIWPELQKYGDILNDFKISIAQGLYKLAQYLNVDGVESSANYHIAVKRSDLEDFGKYGIGAYGGVQMGTYNLVKAYPHEVALALSIGASFFGPVGLLVSSGIMIGDAALYYKEGDYNMAGLSAIFAVLPFLKVPGLKQWTAAQWGKFGQRVSANTYKTLAASDRVVLQQLAKSKDAIAAAAKRYTTAAAKGAASKYTIAAMKTDPIKFIARKFANGTLKTAKLTAFLAKEAIPYLTADKAWQFIYETYGIDEKSLKAMDDYNLNKALSELEKSEMN